MFGRKKKDDNRKIVKKREFDQPNFQFIILVIALTTMGLLMIFSASAVLAYVSYKDTFYFFKKQVAFIIVGVILAIIIYRLKPQVLKKLSFVFMGGGLLLLLYTMPQAIFKIPIPGVVTLNGATRWIRVSTIFDIQPSEVIKVGMILFIPFWLTLGNKARLRIEKWIDQYRKREVIYPIIKLIYKYFPVVIALLIAIMILFQKDLDTIVVIILTFFCVYYVGSTSKNQTKVLVFLIIGAVVVGSAASILEPFRRERVQSYLQIVFKGQPDDTQGSSFQIWNGLVAIGSGGFFGVGYGESRQKLFFLQEAAYTDSIFAVFAEEFGLLGSVFLVIGYIYFLSLGLQIAKKSNDKFLALIAVGVTSWVVIQAFLNIGANLAIIPFGGMPLPFFTYGGSNTIMTLIAVGLLVNISKKSNTGAAPRMSTVSSNVLARRKLLN